MSTLKLTVANDGIAVVTLANPPINAMDAALLEKLANLFEGLAADRAVRAAVIAADGPAFSAGLDLKTTPGLDRLGQRRLIDALNDGFGTLYGWPKPLVAAVNGHAIAGGLILALCADWRIVADVPMQISLAEVRVGVTYPVAAAGNRAPRTRAVGGAPPDPARRDGRCRDRRGARHHGRARAGRGPAGARHRPGRAPRHACRRKPSPPSSANCAPPSSSASPRRAQATASRGLPPGSVRRCGAPPPPCCALRRRSCAGRRERLRRTASAGYRAGGEDAR